MTFLFFFVKAGSGQENHLQVQNLSVAVVTQHINTVLEHMKKALNKNVDMTGILSTWADTNMHQN